MTMPAALRGCRRCDLFHYENCPTCFGFGVYASGSPIAAGTALRIAAESSVADIAASACPSCGSTVTALGRNPSPDTSDPLTLDI